MITFSPRVETKRRVHRRRKPVATVASEVLPTRLDGFPFTFPLPSAAAVTPSSSTEHGSSRPTQDGPVELDSQSVPPVDPGTLTIDAHSSLEDQAPRRTVRFTLEHPREPEFDGALVEVPDTIVPSTSPPKGSVVDAKGKGKAVWPSPMPPYPPPRITGPATFAMHSENERTSGYGDSETVRTSSGASSPSAMLTHPGSSAYSTASAGGRATDQLAPSSSAASVGGLSGHGGFISQVIQFYRSCFVPVLIRSALFSGKRTFDQHHNAAGVVQGAATGLDGVSVQPSKQTHILSYPLSLRPLRSNWQLPWSK
jgi:hypothetical protein